jgi:hypothetical protein
MVSSKPTIPGKTEIPAPVALKLHS